MASNGRLKQITMKPLNNAGSAQFKGGIFYKPCIQYAFYIGEH